MAQSDQSLAGLQAKAVQARGTAAAEAAMSNAMASARLLSERGEEAAGVEEWWFAVRKVRRALPPSAPSAAPRRAR